MEADRKAMRLTLLWGNAVSEVMGIHPTDALALTYLLDAEAVTVGDLGGAIGLSSGATTAAVDRLERAGLAKRFSDPGDRRKVLVKAVGIPDRLLVLRAALRGELDAKLTSYSDRELTRFLELRQTLNGLLERTLRQGRVGWG